MYWSTLQKLEEWNFQIRAYKGKLFDIKKKGKLQLSTHVALHYIVGIGRFIYQLMCCHSKNKKTIADGS